jgi:hypothetical protein
VQGSTAAAAAVQEAPDRGPPGYQQYIGRTPAVAHPIATEEQYERCVADYDEKHTMYLALHNAIEAKIAEVRMASAAAEAAKKGSSEHFSAENRLKELLNGAWSQQERWDAAFRVLHVELENLKGVLVSWCKQRRQVEVEGQGGGMGLGVVAPQQIGVKTH